MTHPRLWPSTKAVPSRDRKGAVRQRPASHPETPTATRPSPPIHPEATR